MKRIPLPRLTAIAMLAAMLAGCGTLDRIKNIGKAPDLNPVTEPQVNKEGRSLAAPIPHEEPLMQENASLWKTGARAFFKDTRASNVGDIVTVVIDIADEAQVENATNRSRKTGESADITNFLGFEGKLAKVLPQGFDPSNVTNFGSDSSTVGSGSTDRSETINMTIAAIVTHVLPNGNLVIQGRQEVRVNFEVRELIVTGIIRPEDISRDNTIQHTQIAEARISYGGRGQLTDMQQARYGTQLYDILFPF